jgi:hypothetical protein
MNIPAHQHHETHETAPRARSRRSRLQVVPTQEPRSDTSRVVLAVALEGPAGERWSAIGGGDTLEDALAFALDSSPEGIAWRVVWWSDLYGD